MGYWIVKGRRLSISVLKYYSSKTYCEPLTSVGSCVGRGSLPTLKSRTGRSRDPPSLQRTSA